MTQLETIEARLNIFPEYLSYRTDFVIQNTLRIKDFWYYWKTCGILFMNARTQGPLLTFDQWLFLNGHQDLIM